jgi:hypothetical protein
MDKTGRKESFEAKTKRSQNRNKKCQAQKEYNEKNRKLKTMSGRIKGNV